MFIRKHWLRYSRERALQGLLALRVRIPPGVAEHGHVRLRRRGEEQRAVDRRLSVAGDDPGAERRPSRCAERLGLCFVSPN